MKRREFLSSVGAVAVLPLSAAAAPTAAAPVHAQAANWAALFARAKGRASPELIQRWLGVGSDQASALMSDLVKRNIIHNPVAGSAASVQPMYARGIIPGVTNAPTQILRKTRDVFETLVHDDGPEITDQPTDEDAHETS